MHVEPKTTCWLNNVVQTWYNMLFKHDEMNNLNNRVTKLVNMVVVSLMVSPVPKTWTPIVGTSLLNNAVGTIANSTVGSNLLFTHDSRHVTSTVEPTVLQQAVLFWLCTKQQCHRAKKHSVTWKPLTIRVCSRKTTWRWKLTNFSGFDSPFLVN